GIFHQAVVDVVTDLRALGTDEIDALDRLVDALAIQDPTAQLLDTDAEQVFVLTFDLAPPRFVLRKLLFARGDGALVLVEDVEPLLRLFLLDLFGHDPVPSRTNKKSGDSNAISRTRGTLSLRSEVHQQVRMVNAPRPSDAAIDAVARA